MIPLLVYIVALQIEALWRSRKSKYQRFGFGIEHLRQKSIKRMGPLFLRNKNKTRTCKHVKYNDSNNLFNEKYNNLTSLNSGA